MRKIFTLAAAVLASMAMSAEVVTFTLSSIFDGNSTSAEVTAPVNATISTNGSKSNAKENKISNDGNYFQVILADATFSAASFNGYINSNDQTKNWAFQFSTDGGANWTAEEKQASDGVKEGHDISIAATVPDGANGLRIIRRAGTTAFVYAISLEIGGVTPSTDPVSEVTITGPTEGFVGIPVTLKAKTDKKADKIWWTDKYGTTLSEEAEFTFTPAAEGEVTYAAWAENAYNVSPAFKEHTLTIAGKLCGELIKAVLNGGTSATMSGVIGGTFDTNLGSGKYKLDKGKYIGIQLASGTFMAGDKVTITMSTAGQNYPCLFADKDRTNCLYLATETSDALEYVITLPAAATGLTTLYLARDGDDATYKWNPTVSSISVTRSCETSSNADIAKVWILASEEKMYIEPEEDGITYNIVVPATESISEVSINFSLAHPLASADVASPFVLAVPAAGDPANSQVIVVTAEDGTTQKTYTINVLKNASASTEARLESLSVAGFTLDPAFDKDVFEYSITKAYGAENPATDAVTAIPVDPTAHPSVEAQENSLVITVTAEDGESKQTYTINILEAAAKKDLLEVSFSNGVHGFIKDGNIQVPYLAGEAEPTFEGVKFWNPDGEPTAAIEEGQLVVTGIDGEKATYTLDFIAVTPMEYSEEEVVFSEVPSYIFSVYGFDADKGVKFSKDVEESTNRRISEGKDRIYLALPAAGKVILTSGTGAERPVTITVNGVASSVTKTAKKNEAIEIGLSIEGNNFVAIESNGSNGDGGFIKLQLSQDKLTAIDYTTDGVKAVKFIQNGQIFILRGEKIYTITGQEL